MNDLEMTRLCAEAMGHDIIGPHGNELVCRDLGNMGRYAPLHDDAQAMALVKKFGLLIEPIRFPGLWGVSHSDSLKNTEDVENTDLNRAIVECVARMRKEQGDPVVKEIVKKMYKEEK